MSDWTQLDTDTIPRLNMLVDSSLTVLYAGRQVRKILGELTGLSGMFAPEDMQRLCEAVRKSRTITLRNVKPVGFSCQVIVSVAPFDSRERISSLVIVRPAPGFADKEEAFSPEDFGRKGIEYLSKAVRNTAATILGCTNILARQLPDGNGAIRYLQTIGACCQELVRKSSNLLETMEEAGGEKLLLYNYEFVDFLRELYHALAKLLEGNRLELRQELPQSKLVIAFDKACIERVLVVLVTNMIGNIGTGTRIRISLKDLGDWLEVCLSHNGPALPKKRVLSFFEPFSDSKNRKAYSDAGFSLCMCRSLIMRHSGSIYIKTNIPGNFTVAFTLPKRTVETDHVFSTGGQSNSFEKLLRTELARIPERRRFVFSSLWP